VTTGSLLRSLECAACGRGHDADRVQGVCAACGKPLFCRYDLARARASLTPATFAARGSSLWRWRELLPVRDARAVADLGESTTPLIELPELAAELGVGRLRLKEEGTLPTGSFKARGMAVAISRARELGVRGVFLPSAGNAGGAAAAYGRRAGLEVRVWLPEETPAANRMETEALGARVARVPGHIGDAGRRAREEAGRDGLFDLSTLREPYRLEGKRTMGLELFEAGLPTAIVYPAGGGTGLIALWKVFAELRELGWLEAAPPRLFVVQAEGCAPVVRAFREGLAASPPVADPRTIASGLRVPAALGDFLMLRAVRESGGDAEAVSDATLLETMGALSSRTGVLLCPEGAAALAAVPALARRGKLGPLDDVVVFHTASGLKYREAWEAALARSEGPGA